MRMVGTPDLKKTNERVSEVTARRYRFKAYSKEPPPRDDRCSRVKRMSADTLLESQEERDERIRRRITTQNSFRNFRTLKTTDST